MRISASCGGRGRKREKGGKGESDCEDGRGRGRREEATGIGSLHWFLVGSWYELVVELLQDLSGDDGVIELHKTVPRHRAAEGEYTRDFHTVMLTCSHVDTDCGQCTRGLGELCRRNSEHRHTNVSIIEHNGSQFEILTHFRRLIYSQKSCIYWN